MNSNIKIKGNSHEYIGSTGRKNINFEAGGEETVFTKKRLNLKEEMGI